MEFLQVIESIEADKASVSRLFGGEGTGIRSGGRRRTPNYMNQLSEALELVTQVYEGRKPMHYLQEAMTTSDFPLLFGDIIDRQLLGSYREVPQTFRNYLKVSQVRDFRQVSRFRVDGAESTLSKVPEQTEYPEAKVDEAKYNYAVEKYGRRMPFSWEAIINDDLEALRDAPERMGRSSRRTEEKFATGLFAAASGPNGTFFAAGNSNIITANPVLSIAALQTALTVLAAQRDADGEPIAIETVELVVPPALEVVASNILNAIQIEITAASAGGVPGDVTAGVGEQRLVVANWMRNRLRLNVNYYLPIISTTNGNTSWYLFASVASGGRPAAEVGFLRGHEEPEVFMKSPNAVRVGGGTVDPMDGDFDTDSIEYKVRHVLGGVLMDPKMAVASNGTGS